MKKITRPFMILGAVSVLFTQSGCYGPFALTNNFYDWNDQATDNRYVKSLIFVACCIIPIYEFCLLADAVILNLIEFWTGSNPIGMKEGDYEQQVVERKGIHYKMEATCNRLSVTPIEGKEAGITTAFVYSPEKSTWSIEKEGKSTPFAHLNLNKNGNNSVTYFTASGGKIQMDLPSNESEMAALKAERKVNFATR